MTGGVAGVQVGAQRGTIDSAAIDVEEVPMPHHYAQRSARFGCGLALITLSFLGACSSSPSSSDSGQTASTKVDPLPCENSAYLLSIGWEKDQAVCVSRLVKVDLEELLSAADGSAVPTEKPGFDGFADAVRTCLRKDADLSSTTVPAG